MSDGTATARLHYMDAMRSVLMLLGVVLHSARPYDSQAWQVKDTARLEWLDWLGASIHLFRMPAFFLVAGFLAMHLLLRRPTLSFLGERLRRSLVPMLATLLTFNLAQVWVVAGNGGDAGFLRSALLPSWASGRWVSHLWFLAVLAVYFLLTALLAPLLRRLGGRTPASWLGAQWTLPLLLAACVFAPLAVAVLAKLTTPALDVLVLGTVSTSSLLNYLPFFAMGVLLCAGPGLLDRFARRDRTVCALALYGLLAIVLVEGWEGVPYRVLAIVATALFTWMVVRIVFSAFRDWANRPSPLFEYLSYASYSIYLFHHAVVITTATILLPLPLAAGIKFLIVLATASLLPLALHHFLILRHATLGYLFNGRVVPRRRPAAAAAQPGAAMAAPLAEPPVQVPSPVETATVGNPER